MRIAGIDPERKFGGGEVQVMGLTLELLRTGHDVELLCDPEGELWRRAQQAGIACHPLRIRNSLDAAAGWRLRTFLGGRDYDLVHFHTARAHALAPYAMGRTRALVVTRRMDYVPNRWFAPWLYNRAVDGVAAISKGVAEALVRGGVEGQRIVIIPSGVDCTRFAPVSDLVRQQARAKLGLLPHQVAIGTIGALVARKGHRVLIDAMALARGRIGDDEAVETANGRLHCFIAGDGPLRHELAERISRNGLTGCATLLGRIADPATLLNALDVFAMPSLNEGMGVAALEASAVGLPLIASAVGGLMEVVDNGHSGMLVKVGDPAMLADAIVELAGDPERRRQMACEGRRRAVHEWSMELMGERTLKLYYDCLNRKHSDAVVRAEK